MLKDKTILCDSNISWDFNRYSKHHLMAQFAINNRVFFVNPQIDWFECFKQNKLKYLRRIKNEENLSIVDSLALPFRAKSAMMRRLDPYYFSFQMRQLTKKAEQENLVLFIGNPAKVFLLDSFKNCACSVYHCSDNLPAMFEGGHQQRIIEQEKELMRRVDLVIAVTKPLLEKALKLNPNSFLVEHGVAERFFIVDDDAQEALPDDLAKIKPPRIAYIGSIDRKLDFDLIDYILATHSDKSFIFVGPIAPAFQSKFNSLRKYPNCYYLGVKPWRGIENYFKNIDVGIMPFVDDDWIKYASALKLLEFIAAGKPVVTTPIPIPQEVAAAVKIGKDKKSFSDFINEAIAEVSNRNKGKQISDLAKAMTWENRAEEISTLIEQRLN